MISRVLDASRVPLNSINRHVNIENHKQAFGEELMALQGNIFSGLFISFLFIMKMFSINFMCN
jgi:hypothetical protein